MNKSFIVLLSFSLFIAAQGVTNVHAAKDSKKKAAATDPLAQAQKDRQAELENTEWELELLPRDSKIKGPISDKLVFSDGKVSLKTITEKGFEPSTYTLTAFADSPRGMWEMYQSLKDGEQTLSMRGDWQGGRMDGVISATFDKGKKVETYNFSTQKRIEIKKPETSPAASANSAKALPSSASSGVLVSKENQT